AELREFNKAHEKAGAIKYGQSQLDISDEMDVDGDRARYEADRAKDLRLSATTGIDAVMKAERLDAMFFPGASGAAIAAKPGYPTVIVPFALVANEPTPPFPSGFNAKPGPIGAGRGADAAERAIDRRAVSERPHRGKRRVSPRERMGRKARRVRAADADVDTSGDLHPRRRLGARLERRQRAVGLAVSRDGVLGRERRVPARGRLAGAGGDRRLPLRAAMGRRTREGLQLRRRPD